MRLINVSERILLTLWVGGLWSIGYLAVPTLFATLDDRRLAGSLAGELFHIMNYVGLVCGILLLIGVVVRTGRSWQFWIIITMIVLVSCSEFLIQPMMYEIKLLGQVEGSPDAMAFKRLHGVSAVIYLVTSLMGLSLVVFGLHRKDDGF